MLFRSFSKKTALVFLQVLSSIYLNCKMFIIKAIVTKKTIKPFFIFEGDHYFSMPNARSVMKAISSIRGHLEWQGEMNFSNNRFNFYVVFDF